jgi:hypothetical protein
MLVSKLDRNAGAPPKLLEDTAEKMTAHTNAKMVKSVEVRTPIPYTNLLSQRTTSVDQKPYLRW